MEKKLTQPAGVCLLALFCCALWGSAFPCIKIGYEWFKIEDVGSQILFAGYRFFLSGIFTFLIGCVLERRFLTIKRSSFPCIFRQGLLQTTIQYVFFYVGLANTTGTKGSVINGSNAFISILAAHFLIKSERMTWTKTLGCLFGFAGVVVVNLAPGGLSGGFHMLGEGMVLICTIAYGISTVLLKLISDRESPMTITAYQTLFGGALLIVLGVLLGGKVAAPDARSAALLIYMALLSTGAFSVWTLLLKYNPVGKVAIYEFTIPIFGAALSALLLGEQVFSLQNISALLLISVGIWVTYREPCKRKTDSVQ